MTNTDKDPHAELMRLTWNVASCGYKEMGAAIIEFEIYARTLTDRIAELERMFLAACSDLGAINEALGLDPDDGGAEPILDAIKELEAQLEAVGAGGVGAMVPTVKDSLQVQPAPAVVEPAYWLTENGDLFSRAEFAAMYAPGRKLTPLYMHPAPQPHQIAEPASPWVSVAERLPPAHTDVMIYPRPTDYCCEAAVNTNGCWSYSEYESNWGQHRVPCRVTHWMPFPAAPTKEPS